LRFFTALPPQPGGGRFLQEAPMGATTELEMLRIFISEKQKHEGRPLYEAIVQEAQKHGLTGAMVSRGFMGFWKYGPISTSTILRLNEDLPVCIEIADEHGQIDAFLPQLEDMIKQGLVALEKVRVVINRDEET
jgi:PII-like signaling protein